MGDTQSKNPFAKFAMPGEGAKPSLGSDELSALAGELLQQLETVCAVSAEERARREAEWAERDAAERAAIAAANAADARRRRYAVNIGVLPPKLAAGVESASDGEDFPAVSAAIRWWAGNGRVLLLRGGVGSGKSTTASVIVRECATRAADRAGQPAKPVVSWMRPNDFVSAILHAYDEGAPKIGCDLVVIDDVGLGDRPEFETALCVFLDDHAQRLVMTTNLTKEAFRERYGMRVVDRLNECGSAITIKGTSRRKQSGDF